MSSEIAINVRGLTKEYTISKGGLEKESTLVETMLKRLRNPLKRATKETFSALSGIDMEIKKGEVVGIIGRNGAGKSTLLKVLSRITAPTVGEIDIYGRVGSLLEVGTGFHPELTGRENIFLNGAVLGMTRPEIRREFDAIVNFAGVESFLETPVKRYSSGMYVRLAFAVAAHLRTEILIVDEVLAVGDAEFQQKCLGKMREVAGGEGRTVLFVSHQMQSVRRLCDRGVLLNRGQVEHQGDIDSVVTRYLEYLPSLQQPSSQIPPERRPGSGQVRFGEVSLGKQVWKGGEPITVDYELFSNTDELMRVFLVAQIRSAEDEFICECNSRLVNHWVDVEVGASARGQLTINGPWLKPGNYRLDLLVCAAGVLDRYEHAATICVGDLLPYPSPANVGGLKNAMVLSDFDFQAVDTPQHAVAAAEVNE